MKIDICIALIILVLLAGCAYVPQGDTTEISFYGEMNRTESGFEINGSIMAGGGIPERDVYRGVSITLYSANGELLCREPVGQLTVGAGLQVTFSTQKQPKYVTVESRDFWKEPMEVDYHVYNSGEELYFLEEAPSKDDLPAGPVSSEKPRCSE